AIAELTTGICAPRPNRPVGGHCQRMAFPGGDRDDVRQRGDLDGRVAFSRGSVSELTRTVASPRPERAVFFDGKGRVAGDGYRADACEDRSWRTARARGAVSHAPELVAPPGPQCPVAR